MGESWKWFVPAEKTWMRSVRGVSCVAGGEGKARDVRRLGQSSGDGGSAESVASIVASW